MENSYKSHINIYWSVFSLFIFLVISVSYFFIKETKNFSFEFYFLMIIPLWIAVLGANGYETQRIKISVREYLDKNYPNKLKEFDEKPVELLNSDTEDILDLFKDDFFSQDPVMNKLQIEADNITKFMYSVFIIMPILLVTTYFFVLK